MDARSSSSTGIVISSSPSLYASKKSGTSPYSYDRVSLLNAIHEYDLSRCSRISVVGYDTSLPEHYIRNALINIFRPCGRIYAIKLAGSHGSTFKIPDHNILSGAEDILSGAVKGCGFIFFGQNGAQAKALALDGINVEGWKLVVKALPKLFSKLNPDHVAALKQADYRFTRSTPFFIRGYDTSLPLDDVKSALIKHFSPCGDITYLEIRYDYPRTDLLASSGVLSIYGEGAVEKVLSLNGTDVRGWKLLVEAFPEPQLPPTPDPRCLGFK